VNPNLSNAETQVVEWLRDEFGIRYVSDRSERVTLDPLEVNRLYKVLRTHKRADETAKSDASLILTIYALRELRNEMGSSSIFGYKTWWLSKDTATQKDVNRVFKDKYKVSCYIRPDFLYNYISLAPSRKEVESAYQELFPSLVGVNISFHLPKEIIELVHTRINEHRQRNPTRVKGIMADLANKLQADPNCQTRQFVKHYLDEQLKNLSASA
jgi:hypothetical protein